MGFFGDIIGGFGSLFSGGDSENHYRNQAIEDINRVQNEMPAFSMGHYTRPAAYAGQQYVGESGRLRERIGAGNFSADSRDALMRRTGSPTSALALAREAALGNAPSAAMMQMRIGADDLARQQMQLASGARGGNRVAAMRNAAIANQGIALRTNQQAAQLRAQEMSNARGQYGALEASDIQQRLAVGARRLAEEEMVNNVLKDEYNSRMGVVNAALQGTGLSNDYQRIRSQNATNIANIRAGNQTWGQAASRAADGVGGLGMSIGKAFVGGGF